MYWNDVVTILHKTVSETGIVTWISTYYDGCYWREWSGSSPNGGGRANTATRIARLPAHAVVSAGDIAVFGYASEGIDEYKQGQRLADFRKKYPKSFVVSAVHDNTGAGRPMPHIYIEGA